MKSYLVELHQQAGSDAGLAGAERRAAANGRQAALGWTASTTNKKGRQ